MNTSVPIQARTGIPMQNGVPTVCSTDPKTGQCIKPYHNSNDVNSGGPHGAASATADIDGGKMDGFVGQFRDASKPARGRVLIRLDVWKARRRT